MRKRHLLSVLGALFALASIAPVSAAAATEFGDTCIADQEFEAPVTLFESSAPANPLPTSAPVSGVITQWKVTVVPVSGTFSQTMKVLRLDAGSHTAQVVGEAIGNLTGGQNTFATRIPVQTGDRLSLYGWGVETLVCKAPGAETLLGGFEGNAGGVGSSTPYSELPEEFRIPVSATIEPDADGDGYGDETQDKCPQSAAFQTECPVVALDAYAVPAKNKVIVLIDAGTEAPVTVSASVKLPKAGKKAKASSTARIKGITHTVTPGKIGRFVLKFPGNLKRTLKELPKGKKLKLNITATATNVAGQVFSHRSALKLKGQMTKREKKAHARKG